MVKQSPHTSWKGCPVCSPSKHKRNGDAERTPYKVLRKLGVKRRYSRNKAYGED
jgi:hypothetical protein